MISRGEVLWWRGVPDSREHIQAGARPVVVVSNDKCNKSSGVITVLPLTTRATTAYPQQVPVVVGGKISVVLGDQITSVPRDELGDHIGWLQPFQMEQVDRAIAVQLGLAEAPRRERSDDSVFSQSEVFGRTGIDNV